MLGIFLMKLGYRVELAGSFRKAVELAVSAQERFDLLLSDLQLPDGDGWSLLRHLEKVGCRPRQAIALSGWARADDKIKSQTAGYRAHLVKPTAPQLLSKALRSAAQAISAAQRGTVLLR